jgi:hypothetical protein
MPKSRDPRQPTLPKNDSWRRSALTGIHSPVEAAPVHLFAQALGTGTTRAYIREPRATEAARLAALVDGTVAKGRPNRSPRLR